MRASCPWRVAARGNSVTTKVVGGELYFTFIPTAEAVG
jgi:hypothetical protein